MKIEIHEAVWLEEGNDFSLAELVCRSGLPESELRMLIEYETLIPIDPYANEARFDLKCLATACMAQRLRNDFDLDAGALALTMSLLHRIRDLESQLRALHTQFPH